MKKAPCKDCPNRQVGCHSTCEKYIEYKKESDRIREEKHAQNELKQFDRERSQQRYKRLRNSKKRR